MECYLLAQERSWYDFMLDCMTDGGVMKRDEMQFCSLDFGSIRYKETLVKLAEVSDFAHCRELIVTMLTEMK